MNTGLSSEVDPHDAARSGTRAVPGGGLRRWLRVVFWRIAWWCCGGLTVTGRRPRGPAVLIANHRSHADSAALLAALPTDQEVVFAAAADYWFAQAGARAGRRAALRPKLLTALRTRLLTGLVPSIPIERTGSGAYAGLRSVAGPVLRRGGIVVIYPEGTRLAPGASSPAEFRAGAAHLARDLGVALVPVAIEGTDRVLPKHGRFHRHPAAVTFGAPVAEAPTDGRRLRALVTDLLSRTVVPAPDPWFAAVERRMQRPSSSAMAFGWGFAEALVWPLLAEMSLILWGVTAPRRILRQAAFLAVGSVVGVVLHAWLASHGVRLPLLLTTDRMVEAAAADLAAGPFGLVHQAVSGIPVKVYAVQAGVADLALPPLALAATLERGARILTIGAVLTGAAHLLRPVIRRYYRWYLVVVSMIFVAALAKVVQAWS